MRLTAPFINEVNVVLAEIFGDDAEQVRREFLKWHTAMIIIH